MALCVYFIIDKLRVTTLRCNLKQKIKEAKKLLRQEELSIAKISDMLEYSSIHNFSRAFKKLFGVSPKQWRERQGEDSANI